MIDTFVPEPIIVASRRQATLMDDWVEDLGYRVLRDGIELGTWGDSIIGDTPNHWFDEDGELLEDLPLEFEGCHFTHADSEYVYGKAIIGRGVTISFDDAGKIEQLEKALGELDWPASDARLVLTSLTELGSLQL